eukprot:PhF_6_TR6283/c0_g1_i1/m.9515
MHCLLQHHLSPLRPPPKEPPPLAASKLSLPLQLPLLPLPRLHSFWVKNLPNCMELNSLLWDSDVQSPSAHWLSTHGPWRDASKKYHYNNSTSRTSSDAWLLSVSIRSF